MVTKFKDGEVTMSMFECIRKMLEEFPIKCEDSNEDTHLAGTEILWEDLSKKLGKDNRELFHAFVARALHLCKMHNMQPLWFHIHHILFIFVIQSL